MVTAKVQQLRADHFRIPLPVTLSNSTHVEITHFELVTVRLRDREGAEGLGYTYTVGAGGTASQRSLRHIPDPTGNCLMKR